MWFKWFFVYHISKIRYVLYLSANLIVMRTFKIRSIQDTNKVINLCTVNV